ncbi:MAG: carboxylating nicotinate-nucleotide diphosphorylase [Puniceicoccales bacterium]|jgi:nicotinate-nucleotide pyrophosphorylase (carboxylating)|nr:carboxylating nicotinate-nucleotide diphosphorylase [Puniceicoccales bacterium]
MNATPTTGKKNLKLSDALAGRLRWKDLDLEYVRTLVEHARDEDTGGLGLAKRPERAGDPTTELLRDGNVAGTGGGTGGTAGGVAGESRAVLRARRDCIVCGLPLVPIVLMQYAQFSPNLGKKSGLSSLLTVHPLVEDGASVARDDALATIEGDTTMLLMAERVLLNFLQRLTGIATHTFCHAAALAGTATRLLDTRKTTPGWRMLEKYAVATGGGWNHRLGLFDRIMLKDNHLAAGRATAGERLAALVRRARAARPDLPVECEVDAIEQLPPVLDAGADVVLLDNFPPAALADALALVGDRAWTEVSGGVTLDTLPAIARLRPDFVSTGALTHQATWVDIGMDWD